MDIANWPEAFPVLLRASAMPATKRPTGVPLPWPRLHLCAAGGGERERLSCLHQPPDRPDEPGELARDGCHCDVQLLPTASKRSISRA
jgi:hypothetical protein